MNDGVGEVTLGLEKLLRQKSLPDCSIIATFEGSKFFSLLYCWLSFMVTLSLYFGFGNYISQGNSYPSHEHCSPLCGCKASNQVTWGIWDLHPTGEQNTGQSTIYCTGLVFVSLGALLPTLAIVKFLLKFLNLDKVSPPTLPSPDQFPDKLLRSRPQL